MLPRPQAPQDGRVVRGLRAFSRDLAASSDAVLSALRIPNFLSGLYGRLVFTQADCAACRDCDNSFRITTNLQQPQDSVPRDQAHDLQ